MSHLVALSVGPVQEFIAAARRTRDLFAGSRLLSDLCKAAALGMQDAGADLVFPSRDADVSSGSSLLVANIILAEVSSGASPEAVLAAGKKAVNRHWLEVAATVRSSLTPGQVIRTDVWDQQVDDVLELFGAWVGQEPSSSPGRTAYQKARDQLMRLMAGRKALRNFLPSPAFPGLPKSSLDGQRDTVLEKDRRPWPAKVRWNLRLKPGEQLDSVGVIKRAHGGKIQFPSVSRIAADAWLRGIKDEHLPHLRNLCDVCDQGMRDQSLDITRLTDHQFSRFNRFPYEGSALYATRHSEFTQGYETVTEPVAAAVRDLKATLKPLIHAYGEPDPYVAVLVADGDKMGEALAGITDAQGHRLFSSQLAAFAGNAKRIVEEHQGSLVYSGGDDVLAILPVDQCLPCARELAADFNRQLQGAVILGTPVPTLSVGIAIAHSMEDLEDLLNYGRAAEKNAKNPRKGEGDKRNGLAVHVHKRGGGPVRVRANWNLATTEESLDTILENIADLINGHDLPSRFASELQVLARQYHRWPEDENTRLAIQKDTLRVLKRKQGGAANNAHLQGYIAELTDSDSIQRWAERILVARQIAVGKRMADGVNQ